MKVIAWTWVAFVVLLLLAALSDQLWFTSFLFLVAIFAVLPPLWSRLFAHDPGGKLCSAASAVAFAAAIISLGVALEQTPEGKARQQQAALEEA